MFLYIYKITNLLNGKIYVGKHSSNKINNSYLGSGVAIRRAIARYGKQNFKKDILCLCKNKAEQNQREIEWIEKTGAFGEGYNLTKGGEGSFGRTPSKDEIERARVHRLRFYRENPEARKSLSEAAKLRTGEKNSFFGKKLSKEHIEKMTKARINAISGDKNPSAVKVMCIDTGIVYNTAKEAAKSCGLKYSTTILKAAKGERNKAGGYEWKLV